MEILDTREGNEELECTLQLRFLYYKANILKEWFLDDSDILKHFQDSIDDIDMWLWIHRDDVFQENTKSKRIKNIFKRIWNKFAPIDDPMYEGSDLEDRLLK